jgi:HEPN domain-containing protein
MKEITKQWLEFAKTDLMSCKNNMQDPFLTNIIAFHAHQAVEKCFKSIIEERNLEMPRIHNLLRLHGLIKDFCFIDVDLDMLSMLDGVYTTSRYPGDWGLLTNGKPTTEIAEKFYEFAKSIYEGTIIVIGQ